MEIHLRLRGDIIGRKKNLTKKEKEIIATLYQNRNLSIGKIADVIGCSRSTVNRYKNYE